MKFTIPWRRFNLTNAAVILGLAGLVWLFALQRAIIPRFGAAGYLDELFAICVVGIALVRLILGRWDKLDTFVYLSMLLLTIIGLVSNYFSGLLNNSFAIVIDIISTFKVILAFLWVKDIECDRDRVIRIAAQIGRAVVVVMAVCMAVSLFKDIGMTSNPRYGMQSFRFVFNNAGNCSKFFYFLVPLLLADLKSGITQWKKATLVLACILWLLTLRSRAFSFVALLAVFAFWYFRGGEKKVQIRWYHVILLGAVAVYFSWDKLIQYFMTSTQARGILLRYSIVTMMAYFPWGSGFGTYGSDIAATYYSPLYEQYGFRRFYGMGHGHTHYLNDNYWPMIFGQFGVIGTALMVGILGSIHKKIFISLKNDRYYLFAAVCAMAFLLLSSVASKSYSEFSSICIFLLLGLLVPRRGEQTESSGDKGKEE